MKSKFFFLSLLSLSLSLSLPLLANANTYSVSNNFYIGLGAGMISPNDVDINISAGTYDGVTFSDGITGEWTFENGYQITGLLGYRINDYLSFESELGYMNFDYDKLNLTIGGTATSGGVTFNGGVGSFDVVGNISAFSMIFGPAVDMDIYENLELLISGGIGFTSFNDEITSVGASTGLSYDEDNTEFAAKFKTGFNYSFSQQSYLQTTYGYNFVDSGVDNYTDDLTAHSFDAKLIFNF